MATTNDKLQVDVAVNGLETLDQANGKFVALDKNVKQINDTVRSFNTRTLSANIQDIAVQAELGVNGLRILGQQGSEVLAAFGPKGAAAGAALALGIALARPVMSALNVDLRNLNEKIKDLSDRTNEFKDAQKANLQTTDGLRASFGGLTDSAKRYNEVSEKFSKAVAFAEMGATIDELKNKFIESNVSIQSLNDSAQGISFEDAAMSASVLGNSISFVAMRYGLTVEQAQLLSDKLKALNKESKPEDLLKAVTEIKEGFLASGMNAETLRKVATEVIDPLSKGALQAKSLEENIAAASLKSSELSVKLLNVQASFLPGIGDAKRRFDQIGAVQLEAAGKIAEYRIQLDEKVANSGLKPEQARAELTAFTNKTLTESVQKQKDIQHAQAETSKSIAEANDATQRKLGLESKITELQDKGRYMLSYDLQYEEDIAKNRAEYVNSLKKSEEAYRTSKINAEGEAKANKEAAEIRDKADANAEEARKKRKNDAKDAQTALLFEIEGKKNSIEYDSQALKIRQQMRDAYPEDIDTALKIAALTNAQVDYERAINEEVRLGRKERAYADELISASNENLREAIALEQRRNREAARYRLGTAEEGVTDTVAKMTRENLTEYQRAGKSVEAIYSNMGTAIDRFVETGKFKFSDFTRSVIQDLIKIQMKSAASSFLSSIFGMMGFGGGGGTTMAGASVLGLPGYANGGMVPAGQLSIVGEKGPELFLPNSSGTIVPNASLTGARQNVTTVNYNIQAVDASSFRQLVARDPSFIYAVTERGRRSQPTRRLA